MLLTNDIKRFQLEAQKPFPEKDTIRCKMNLTYLFRRNEIIKSE